MKTFLAFLATLSMSRALDVEVTDYQCDQSLYVTADFQVRCDGSKKCTFGVDTAEVFGTLYYNMVYQTGIEDNVGYLSTDVELLTLKYNFHEMLPIPLCSYYLEASEYNPDDCPGDGSYGFNVHYKLPSAGDSTSWLASGWAGSGVFRIYAEEDENMLIGECTFNLKTSVTPAETGGFFQAPSAAATVGIVLGALAAVGIICTYCYCCMKNRRNRVTEDDIRSVVSLTPDQISTIFKKLDEEKRASKYETTSLTTSPMSVGAATSASPQVPADRTAASIANPTSTAPAAREADAEEEPASGSLMGKFFSRKKKKSSEGKSPVSEMAL